MHCCLMEVDSCHFTSTRTQIPSNRAVSVSLYVLSDSQLVCQEERDSALLFCKGSLWVGLTELERLMVKWQFGEMPYKNKSL